MRANQNLWFLVLIAVGASCGGDAATPVTCTVNDVSVTASAPSVHPGATIDLTAAVSASAECGGGVTWSATPAEATLTPSGLHTTFGGTKAGSYTVTATSVDDTSRTGSTTVMIIDTCGTPNGVSVEHKTNISADETWAGDGVTHLVTTSIRILAPATVTIQPCAIVLLAPSAEIMVDGDDAGSRPAKLVSAGTDDATGFITFSPQMAGKPWGWLRGANAQSFLELRHTTLSQAGGGGKFIDYAAIEANGAGTAAGSPVVTADHLTIDHPVGAGLYLPGNASFSADSTQLSVTGAVSHPIELGVMTLGTIPPFVGTDNMLDDALIIGSSDNITADLTITNRIPVLFSGGQTIAVAPPGGAPGLVTLTIQPGATLRFVPAGTSASRLTIGSQSGSNGSNGRLIAVGDATHPILFTSAGTVPAPGDWAGIQLYNAPGSQLSYVTIEYAGGFSGLVSANCRPSGSADTGGLIIGSDVYAPPADLLTHSIIRSSAGFGIDAIWLASTFDSPNLAAAANDNTFTSNAGCDQTYNNLLQNSGSCPAGGGCQPQ